MHMSLFSHTSSLSQGYDSSTNNNLAVSERVESCIATTVFKYWNGIVPSYNNMFKPSNKKYNTGSQMAFDIRLQKTNTRKKALIFLKRKCELK